MPSMSRQEKVQKNTGSFIDLVGCESDVGSQRFSGSWSKNGRSRRNGSVKDALLRIFEMKVNGTGTISSYKSGRVRNRNVGAS